MQESHNYQVIESFYSVSAITFSILECTIEIPIPGTILHGKAGYSWMVEEQLFDKHLSKVIGEQPYYFFRISSTDGILRKPEVGEILTSNF